MDIKIIKSIADMYGDDISTLGRAQDAINEMPFGMIDYNVPKELFVAKLKEE